MAGPQKKGLCANTSPGWFLLGGLAAGQNLSRWPDSNRRTMALPTELQRENGARAGVESGDLPRGGAPAELPGQNGGFRSESNRSPKDRFYRPAPEPSGIRTRIASRDLDPLALQYCNTAEREPRRGGVSGVSY